MYFAFVFGSMFRFCKRPPPREVREGWCLLCLGGEKYIARTPRVIESASRNLFQREGRSRETNGGMERKEKYEKSFKHQAKTNLKYSFELCRILY